MSNTAMTLATAPRDRELLIKIGRFNARVLAQEGGLFPNEESKTAFMQLSSEKQADELLAMFSRLDGKKPAGGKASGGALPSGRSPANGTKAAGGRKPAEQAPADPASGAAAARQPATAPAGEATTKVLLAIQSLQENYNNIAEALDNLSQQSQMQQSSINKGNSMAVLNIAVMLQIAEEVLHAPQSQILQMAFEDMPRLTDEVAKYLPADASDTADEAEEGNES